MLRWLAISFACLVFVAPSPSQTDAPKEQPKQSIQGEVVDAKSGLPIRKAMVQLRGGARLSSATTSTDGTFLIEDLEPGRYLVILKRGGFVQMASELLQTTFTLQSGQQLTGLVYKMQPAGVE
ncbi:MAG: carboxypeptidase-like regulatory domain-containing protein [Candidatus Acidiferrum sp.]